MSAMMLRRFERSIMSAPMVARVAPKVRKSCWVVNSDAASPPPRPPMEVATSRAMARRMFTRPRSRFTVELAVAVAITEMRLAATAARMGTWRARVSSGTRKTPPPMPSIAPTTPARPPVTM